MNITDNIRRILRQRAIKGEVQITAEADALLITTRFIENPNAYTVACDITNMLRRYFRIAKLTGAEIDAFNHRVNKFFCKDSISKPSNK